MRIRQLGRPILSVAAVLLSRGCYGQSPQRFEVVAIKPSQAAMGAGTNFNLFEGGRIRITNEPIRLLIRLAFAVQDTQILGGPSWVETDRYDIDAKADLAGKIKPDQIGALIESLLVERFNLKFHRETREMSFSALIVAKGGPKLKPKAEGESSVTNTSGGSRESHLAATATSMDLLARYVGNRLNRIVIDKTGLSDSYDFTLDWSPDEASDTPAPPLSTALREQLGLRLESQRSPIEVLVIDSIAKPSEN